MTTTPEAAPRRETGRMKQYLISFYQPDGPPPPPEVLAPPAIERAFREAYGRAVAVLVRVCGDIDTAEEAVQDAFVEALERWPATGVPPSPAGWIVTTARNRVVDRYRRESVRDERHAEAERRPARDERGAEGEGGPVGDDPT